MTDKGMVHLYYGNGKGKTTAAFGLALRASGSGLRVVIIQFLKERASGELAQLSLLENITILRGKGGVRFSRGMDDEQKTDAKKTHNHNLREVQKIINKGSCDMLILDEGMDAYRLGLTDEKLFADVIINKPDYLELVITGHKPVEWIVNRADYITQMVNIRHPYGQGIKARKGIEF